MRFIHLADLHLGKKFNEYSLIKDQEFILDEIINIIKDKEVDAILIAGDIYDKSIPTIEAVNLLDDFLYKLSEMKKPVYIISGNHDSIDRLSFGSRMLQASGIHIAKQYEGNIYIERVYDKYGEINIYMLPFVKAPIVNKYFDIDLNNSNDAIKAIIDKENIDYTKRNIILSHQFVSNSLVGGSEDSFVGALDMVDIDNYKGFDYVALGHIHKPQELGNNTRRYAGTPLKYHFDEIKNVNSVPIIELNEKGNINVELVNLLPLQEMAEYKDSFLELMSDKYEAIEKYLHITLIDEEDILDAAPRLRQKFPNLMRLDYDNTRTRAIYDSEVIADTEHKSTIELFKEFFKNMNGMDISSDQEKYMNDIIEKEKNKENKEEEE